MYVLHRVVVSVSMSRSRDGLETYQRLVLRKIVNLSSASRDRDETEVSSRSREADVSVSFQSQPFTSRAQDSFLMGMQMAPYAV